MKVQLLPVAARSLVDDGPTIRRVVASAGDAAGPTWQISLIELAGPFDFAPEPGIDRLFAGVSGRARLAPAEGTVRTLGTEDSTVSLASAAAATLSPLEGAAWVLEVIVRAARASATVFRVVDARVMLAGDPAIVLATAPSVLSQDGDRWSLAPWDAALIRTPSFAAARLDGDARVIRILEAQRGGVRATAARIIDELF